MPFARANAGRVAIAGPTHQSGELPGDRRAYEVWGPSLRYHRNPNRNRWFMLVKVARHRGRPSATPGQNVGSWGFFLLSGLLAVFRESGGAGAK
jgi:hypothetical protein